MNFEWDLEKEQENIRLHGVNFTDAAEIFRDYFRIERRDEDSSGSEDRYQTLGLFYEVLFVVYTEHGEATRIISARIAETFERRIYDSGAALPGGWQRVNP